MKFAFIFLVCFLFFNFISSEDCDTGNYRYCSDLEQVDCDSITFTVGPITQTFDPDQFLEEICCPGSTQCVCDFSRDNVLSPGSASDLVTCENSDGANAGFAIMVALGALGILCCFPCTLLALVLIVVCIPCSAVIFCVCLPCLLPVLFLILGSYYLAQDGAELICDDDVILECN